MNKVVIFLSLILFLNIAESSELEELRSEITAKSGIHEYMETSLRGVQSAMVFGSEYIVDNIQQATGEKISKKDREKIDDIVKKYNLKILEIITAEKMTSIWMSEFIKNYSIEDLKKINRYLDTKEGKDLFSSINNAHLRATEFSVKFSEQYKDFAEKMADEIMQVSQ